MILGIFFIAFAQAQVLINPSPLETSILVGTEKNYTITINNTHPFDIFDLSFENLTQYGVVSINNTIPANSTKDINITFKPITSFSGTIPTNVKFKFFANIPTEITTYDVEIRNNGFYPKYLILREGDTIKWTNKDTIIHNVFSGLFNNNILPNQTYSYTFSTLGTYAYYDTNWDEFSNFHASVEVINRTSQEKVTNPTYDFLWNVNANFFLNPTNLSVNILDKNFEVSSTGSSDSVITLKNIGQENAEHIKVSSDSSWITFSQNDFTLTPNQQKAITFTITPLIFNTADTNKTYTTNLKVTGSNIESFQEDITIFIPYKEIKSTNLTDNEFLEQYERICTLNPNAIICTGRVDSGSANSSSGNQSLNITISTADYIDQKRIDQEQSTALARLQNDFAQFLTSYEGTLPDILDKTNQSVELQRQNEEDAKQSRILRWIIGFFILVCTGIFIMIKRAREVKNMQSIAEGHFEHQST